MVYGPGQLADFARGAAACRISPSMAERPFSKILRILKEEPLPKDRGVMQAITILGSPRWKGRMVRNAGGTADESDLRTLLYFLRDVDAKKLSDNNHAAEMTVMGYGLLWPLTKLVAVDAGELVPLLAEAVAERASRRKGEVVRDNVSGVVEYLEKLPYIAKQASRKIGKILEGREVEKALTDIYVETYEDTAYTIAREEMEADGVSGWRISEYLDSMDSYDMIAGDVPTAETFREAIDALVNSMRSERIRGVGEVLYEHIEGAIADHDVAFLEVMENGAEYDVPYRDDVTEFLTHVLS